MERYRPVDVRSLRPEAWTLRNTLAHHSSTVSSVAWACCRACAAGACGEGGGAAGAAGAADGGGGDECQGPDRCGKLFATGSHDQTIRVYRYAHVAWDDFAQQRAELFAATHARREALAQLKRQHDLACRTLRRVKRERGLAEDALEAARALQREMQVEESLSDEEGSLRQAEEDEADAGRAVVAAEQALEAAEENLQQAIRAEGAVTGCECAATLAQHTDFVVGLVFSPDMATLASASCDGTVRLWALSAILEVGAGVDEGAGSRVFRGHLERVWGLAFSSDGNLLASCSEDRTLRLWQAAPHYPDGLDRSRLQHSGKHGCICHVEPPATAPLQVDKACPGVAFASLPGEVRCVTFSPDARALAAGCGSSIKLFSCDTGEELSHVPALHSAQSPSTGKARYKQARFLGDAAGGAPIDADLPTAEEGRERHGAEGAAAVPPPMDSPACRAAPATDAATPAATPGSASRGFTAKHGDAVCLRCEHEVRGHRGPGPAEPPQRHRGLVLHLCFHPVEHDLTFSCGEDGAVKVWLLTARKAPRVGTAGGGAGGTRPSRLTLSERLVRGLDAGAGRLQGFVRRLPAVKEWKIARLRPMIEARLEEEGGATWQEVLAVLEGMFVGDIDACGESGDLEPIFARIRGDEVAHADRALQEEDMASPKSLEDKNLDKSGQDAAGGGSEQVEEGADDDVEEGADK